MKIIREYDNESLARICHILKDVACHDGVACEASVVGVDEEFLAWFYIAPGEPLTRISLDVLAFARDLIGSGAWAVLEAHHDASQVLLSDLGLRLVESYEDATDDPRSVSVHIVQAVPTLQAGA